MSAHETRTKDHRSAVVFGAGFVGRAVVAALREDGWQVTVLDLPTHPVLAERGDEARQLVVETIDQHEVSVVINCSGLLRGTDEELAAANHLWPEWLVGVLAGSGVRFVHLGSASEYGDPGDDTPIDEDRPANPSGVYGTTKWAGSSSVLHARGDGLDAVVARGFNLVSPEVLPPSPLHQFLSDVDALPASGGEIQLWWPETVRDFILLTDLADAVSRLASAPSVPPVVNVCSGVGVRFADIVLGIARVRNKEVTIGSLDRPGITAVVGDPSLLVEITGVRPLMSVELLVDTICRVS